MDALEKLREATRMLGEVRSAKDAKALADLASAGKRYAEKAKLGKEAILYAHGVNIKAWELYGAYWQVAEKNRGVRLMGSAVLTQDHRETLKELGVSKNEASDAVFLHWLAQAKPELFSSIVNAERTLSAVRRAVDQDETRDRNKALVTGALDPSKLGNNFQTIVIDPPWDYSDSGDADAYGRVRPRYATMHIEEIAALPVGERAQANAHLYLWCVNRLLPQSFGLLEGWGFKYITMLTWAKPSFGVGNYFRNATEHILFGVRGTLPLLRSDCPTWFSAERSKHSAKPAEFYAMVETCSPGPWLDMFARIERPGWVTWGAEVPA